MAVITINVSGINKLSCQGKFYYKDTCYTSCSDTGGSLAELYGDGTTLADSTVLYSDNSGTIANTGYYCCSANDNDVYYWDGKKLTKIKGCGS